MIKAVLSLVEVLRAYFIEKRIFKKDEAVHKVQADARLIHDLSLDSLDFIDLQLYLEKTYGVILDLTDDKGVKDLTVRELEQLLSEAKNLTPQPA